MRKLYRFAKRVWHYIRTKGLTGAANYIDKIAEKVDTCGFYHFVVDEEKIPLDKEALERHRNDEVKILNWIVPEMDPGSGGHTTIFRFISMLENLGYHSKIYIHRPTFFESDEQLTNFLHEHFKLLDHRVECFYDCKNAGFAHATFATSWPTAYFVKNFENTVSKFYFVQDFEPYFYAHGSEYEFAENTYKLGLRAITAGDWLKNKLREEYGMKTESFSFSCDKTIYCPGEKKDDRKRVFFYARPVTPRRDFELGLLALEKLSKLKPDIEVYMAGWDVSNYEIPFDHINFGVVSPQKLAECYHNCDMALVLSNTNLSLLPLEVMGAGCVAVCSVGENSTWLVNEENSVIVNYEPLEIAETMAYYFDHPELLSAKREQGIKFSQSTSWEKEGVKVAKAIKEALEEDIKNV